MPLADTAENRAILSHVFPGIVIDSNALASGQRLVFFCHFEDRPDTPSVQKQWSVWGNVGMLSSRCRRTCIRLSLPDWKKNERS